jgi:hypothetical protein
LIPISTFLGIKIDSSDEYENAADSIRVKCEFDSNVTDANDLQNEKHFDSTISTFLGIKIDSSDEYENASDSIRVKLEFDSNVIDESDLQLEKHFDPRISTFLGIKIDSSDESENISDSIRVKCEFDSNTIDLSGPCSFSMPCQPVGRSQFRMTIEFGIQTRRISILFSVLCATVSIEPTSTTTRR